LGDTRFYGLVDPGFPGGVKGERESKWGNRGLIKGPQWGRYGPGGEMGGRRNGG